MKLPGLCTVFLDDKVLVIVEVFTVVIIQIEVFCAVLP